MISPVSFFEVFFPFSHSSGPSPMRGKHLTFTKIPPCSPIPAAQHHRVLSFFSDAFIP